MHVPTFACLASLILLVGCSGPAGPQRYDLSGSVTQGGRPVPAGYIVFAPDASAGNSGPGAQANIQDGHFQIQPGHGTVGGPHVVTISCFDGVPIGSGLTANPMGSPLAAPHVVQVDIPRESGTHDFVVP